MPCSLMKKHHHSNRYDRSYANGHRAVDKYLSESDAVLTFRSLKHNHKTFYRGHKVKIRAADKRHINLFLRICRSLIDWSNCAYV